MKYLTLLLLAEIMAACAKSDQRAPHIEKPAISREKMFMDDPDIGGTRGKTRWEDHRDSRVIRKREPFTMPDGWHEDYEFVQDGEMYSMIVRDR